MTPVSELVHEPGVPGRMASALRSWSSEIQQYKGAGRYKHVLLPFLDEAHFRQVQDGLVRVTAHGEMEDTSVYPF